jgi:hypothetical protein
MLSQLARRNCLTVKRRLPPLLWRSPADGSGGAKREDWRQARYGAVHSPRTPWFFRYLVALFNCSAWMDLKFGGAHVDCNSGKRDALYTVRFVPTFRRILLPQFSRSHIQKASLKRRWWNRKLTIHDDPLFRIWKKTVFIYLTRCF